jgi:hypothetical protein
VRHLFEVDSNNNNSPLSLSLCPAESDEEVSHLIACSCFTLDEDIKGKGKAKRVFMNERPLFYFIPIIIIALIYLAPHSAHTIIISFVPSILCNKNNILFITQR